jgi:WD40 repeat protein
MRWGACRLIAGLLLLSSTGYWLLATGYYLEADGDELPDAGPAVKPVLVLDAAGHTGPVSAVLFTPDGRQVITASWDKTVRVWDAATGEPLRVLRPPVGEGADGQLFAAALSPDGTTLAVGGYGYRGENKQRSAFVFLIDLAAGRILDRSALRGHTAPVRALAFSPDGKTLASAGDDKVVRLWDVEKRDCRYTLEGHNDSVRSLAWSPDGARLASGGDDRQVLLWSAATGKAERVIKNGGPPVGPRVQVRCLAWSPDGSTLATPGDRATALRLWNAADGRFLKSLPYDRGYGIAWLAFTPDSKGLVAAGADPWYPVLEVRDLESGKRQSGPPIVGIAPPATCGALSPDGKLAAWAGTPLNAVYLWDTAEGTIQRKLGGKGAPIHAVGWIEDGKALAWRSTPVPPNEKRVFFFDRSFDLVGLQLGQALTKNTMMRLAVQGGLSLHPAKEPHTVRVQANAKLVSTVSIRPLSEGIGPFTFVGKDRVAVAGKRRGLFLHDVATGRELQSFRGFHGTVHHIAPSPDGRYLLASADDQALRVYGADRKDPLVSVFVSGGDWVAWTPEGYYAASVGGERLMGWQVNHGLDALGTFYPAAQFHASLYRPDVLSRILAEGSLEKALAAADKERGEAKTAQVEVEEVLPPKVTLEAPKVKDLNLSEPTLEVQAAVQSRGKHPVTSLQLLLDGRPCVGARGPSKGEKPRWVVEVPPGEHTLRVMARTDAGMGLSNDLEVAYVQKGPKAKLYLLAVGINDYASFSKLSCARNDATELEKTLEAKSSPLFDVVPRVLVDARGDDIRAGLRWLKGSMTPQDTAVIFYAGHGDKDKNGTFYLVPQNAQADDLARTGISGEEIKKELKDVKGRVLLLLDACHSGAIGKAVGDLARDLSDDDCGVVVMCAALGSETAGEADGHGYFCRALIEGLTGKAAQNPKDHCVYLHHLEHYVIDRVQELSKDEQHPTSARPALRPFAIARP